MDRAALTELWRRLSHVPLMSALEETWIVFATQQVAIATVAQRAKLDAIWRTFPAHRFRIDRYFLRDVQSLHLTNADATFRRNMIGC
jgi:hypothetical protein